MTKTDLTVIAAMLAVGLTVIETHHRIELIAPAVAEPVAVDPCAAADVRYATQRLVFFSGGYASGMRRPQLADVQAACSR